MTATDPTATRREVLAVAAVFAGNGFLFGGWAARLPAVADQLGVSTSGVGLIVGSFALGGLLGASLAPRVTERLGARRLTLLMALLLTATIALAGQVTNAVLFAVLFVVAGASDVLTDIGMNLCGSRAEERTGRSFMNRLHAAWTAGTLTGAALMALATSRDLDPGPSFTILAVTTAATTVVALRFVPDAPTVADQRAAMGGRTVLVWIVAGGLAGAVEQIPADWGATLTVAEQGGAERTGALVVAAYFTGMLVGRLVADRVVAQVGQRRVLATGPIVVGVGVLLGLLGDDPALTMAAWALSGLGVAAIFPALYGLAAAGIGGPGRLAAMTVGARGGALVTPVVIGALAGQTSLTTSLAVVAPIVVVGLVASTRTSAFGRPAGPLA
ncbi:MAG: MFS transporter [Actinomycetota bacterium]